MSPRPAASSGMKVLMIQLLVVEITEAQPFGLLEAKIYVRESRLEVHWLASADSLHPHRFVQRATQIQHGLAVVPCGAAGQGALLRCSRSFASA
jgi:hypothetical protein